MIHLRLQIHGHARLLRLADEASVGIVETLFPGYVAGRSGQPARTEPHLTVDAGPGGYRLRREGLDELVADADLPVALEHHVTLLLLYAAPDFIHLHAAGMAAAGGAVLALGGSGTGKSSIAVAWSAMGHRVFGDDAVLLGTDLTAHPLRKPLKVDVTRARAAGLTPEDTPYWEDGAAELWYDPEAGGGWALPARPATMAFLERRPTGATNVERLTPLDAARGLLSQILVTSGRPSGWHDTLFDLAEATPAYRVGFSDSLDAARALAAADRAR